MSFQWSEMLWLLFLVPILAGAYILAQRRRKRYALRYASLSLVKNALGRGPGIRRHIPAALFLLGVMVMIIALARPAAVILLPSQRGTVILALDNSGSMRAQDIKPSRFDAAREAAKVFIEKQPRNILIGIVAFSATSALVQAPTADRELIFAAIDRLKMQRGTAVGSGILTSLQAIFEDQKDQPILAPSNILVPAEPPPPAFAPGSYKTAVVVLLTDGQSNTGPDPLLAANEAANRGVRIFTVGIGSREGAVLGLEGRSFRVQLDEESLKRIAALTGGGYSKADNETDLRTIYESLSTRLILEKEKTEITAIFTAVAIGVLLIAGTLSLLWFNRLL
ncbi:MAG: VWA domain-containing protein [Spirochaetota bacterium]